MTDRKLGIAIAVLGLIGLAIASYLTYVHYADVKLVCLANGGCETVQKSKYAVFMGAPVPVLGLIGYIAILASLLIPGDFGRGTTALMTLAGFGFSIYLTWLEIFKIKAICQWCVGSAIVMTILAILAMWRLWRFQPPAATTISG